MKAAIQELYQNTVYYNHDLNQKMCSNQHLIQLSALNNFDTRC